MAIITALHYCCIMRMFLMSHKVSSFSPRDTACLSTMSGRHRWDIIVGLYGCAISFNGCNSVFLHSPSDEKVFLKWFHGCRKSQGLKNGKVYKSSMLSSPLSPLFSLLLTTTTDLQYVWNIYKWDFFDQGQFMVGLDERQSNNTFFIC